MTILKIDYGNVYIQIPDDDLEAIDLAIDVLDFFLKRAKKKGGD